MRRNAQPGFSLELAEDEIFLVGSFLLHRDTSYLCKEWDVGNPSPPSSLLQENKRSGEGNSCPENQIFLQNSFPNHELSVGKMVQGMIVEFFSW